MQKEKQSEKIEQLEKIENLTSFITGETIPTPFGHGCCGRWKNLRQVLDNNSKTCNVRALAIKRALWGESNILCPCENERELVNLVSDALLDTPDLLIYLGIRERTITSVLKEHFVLENGWLPGLPIFKDFFRSWCKLLANNWSAELVRAFSTTKGYTVFPDNCVGKKESEIITKFQKSVLLLEPSANNWTMREWSQYKLLRDSCSEKYNCDVSGYYSYDIKLLLKLAESVVCGEDVFVCWQNFSMNVARALWPDNTEENILKAFRYTVEENKCSHSWEHHLFGNVEDYGIYKLVAEMSANGNREAKEAIFDFCIIYK